MDEQENSVAVAEPAGQVLGTVRMAPPLPPEKKPEPVQEVDSDAEADLPEGTLDSLIAQMRKTSTKKGPEPQEEAKSEPASQSVQPVEDHALPGWLISRAADYGITPEEAKDWKSEAALSKHIDGLQRVVQHFTKPKEEPKPEVKEEDIWGGKRDLIDDDLVATVERLEKRYADKVAALEAELKFVSSHVTTELRGKNRTAFDKMLDGLEGYEEHLGKGEAKEGTPTWDNRAKLETMMRLEAQLYEQAGAKLDRADSMKIVASRLFGTPKETKPEAKPEAERKVPPKDPKTGQFTATNRPTSRTETAREKGPRAAAEWVKANIADFEVKDIHDED